MPSGTSVKVTFPLRLVSSEVMTGPSSSTRANSSGCLVVASTTTISISADSDCARASGVSAAHSMSRPAISPTQRRNISSRLYGIGAAASLEPRCERLDRDRYGRAVAGRAVDRDVAADALDRALCNCEAEPRTGDFATLIAAIEALESVHPLRLRHSRAFVAHANDR